MAPISVEKCSTYCKNIYEAVSNECLECLYINIQKKEPISPRTIKKIALLSVNYNVWNEDEKKNLDALLFILDKMQEFFPFEFKEAYVLQTIISSFAPLYFVRELYYTLKGECPSFDPRAASSDGVLPLAMMTTSNLKKQMREAITWSDDKISDFLKEYIVFLLEIGASPNDLLDAVNGATVIYMSLYARDWIVFKLLFPYVFPYKTYPKEEYDVVEKNMVTREQCLMQFIIEEGYWEVFVWITETQLDMYGNVIRKPMISPTKEEKALMLSPIEKIREREEEKYQKISNAYIMYCGSK